MQDYFQDQWQYHAPSIHVYLLIKQFSYSLDEKACENVLSLDTKTMGNGAKRIN